jgi:hypothetical protein
MRHHPYQTMVPVSHEENIYLPTGGFRDKVISALKQKDADSAAAENTGKKESMLPNVLKVVLVLALVFGVGLGVPISLANRGERCCRDGKDRTALLHYCKNTDPIDMWQAKSGRNCDWYEKKPEDCDEDSNVLGKSKCFDEVRWKDDVKQQSCAEQRSEFILHNEENSDVQKAWCETAFGETNRASRKDENGKWIYFPSNMTAQAACCFCGEKTKTANFEAINTPKKHCCGCRIKKKKVGYSVTEEYDYKVSDEGGSCDSSTDKKVDLDNQSELVSRNEICSGDPNLTLAWFFAIVWWVVVIYLTKRKYFPNKKQKEDKSSKENSVADTPQDTNSDEDGK